MAEYVTVFNCVMEEDWIQCHGNKKILPRAKKSYSNSDAMLLIATFLFLQLCCVIMC